METLVSQENGIRVRIVRLLAGRSVLRAMLYYPMNAGRSVAEIHRLVVALQASAILILLALGAWTSYQRVLASERLRVDRVDRVRRAAHRAVRVRVVSAAIVARPVRVVPALQVVVRADPERVALVADPVRLLRSIQMI